MAAAQQSGQQHLALRTAPFTMALPLLMALSAITR
jgi:hypothetical protein